MKERWLTKHIEFLKRYYSTHGAKYCAIHCQCSPARVRLKAARIGLKQITNPKNTKICKGCFLPKKLSDFSPHSLCRGKVQSKCKTCKSQWESCRKRTDKNYRLLHNIRNRIRIAIKKNCKATSSRELLGCSIAFLKDFIAGQFQKGMSWDNHGQWHLDHKIPCSSFDMSDPKQQKACFHYSNLQPLWAKENLSKGRKSVIK